MFSKPPNKTFQTSTPPNKTLQTTQPSNLPPPPFCFDPAASACGSASCTWQLEKRSSVGPTRSTPCAVWLATPRSTDPRRASSASPSSDHREIRTQFPPSSGWKFRKHPRTLREIRPANFDIWVARAQATWYFLSFGRRAKFRTFSRHIETSTRPRACD